MATACSGAPAACCGATPLRLSPGCRDHLTDDDRAGAKNLQQHRGGGPSDLVSSRPESYAPRKTPFQQINYLP